MHRMQRPGQWFPTDHRVHKDWLSDVIDHIDTSPKGLHPVPREFKDLIESNTLIYLVNSMFEQLPTKKSYSHDPTGHKQVWNYHHMLQLFNRILTMEPSWSDKSYRVGMVGTPFNAILNWPMGTPSRFAFFLDPPVNKMLKKILNARAEYLSSPPFAYVLGNDLIGWFSPHGIGDLAATANVGQTSYKFEELFQCDQFKKYHGFKSWDHFTRQFRNGNVAARDRFWVKGQPYSLVDMPAHDSLYEHFVGGTIYKAFLSALSDHRWHAPISAIVKKAYPGRPSTQNVNAGGEANGQGYLTATATRAFIFIEADNKHLGIVGFLGIAMTEVSSCDITTKEGQHVRKGDEIGMFHYSSTHCLLFRKGVELDGFPLIG
ncbi:hypothetical protein K458DRAFT_447981 [Lentithecium fluviatile CBS 122367]|uniref:L-tryptophan decarboxylase PsiD-like domain-containing protein n=1 Tax=Lentithecium fluviatile CBS 122367 TaxID=1168545 RepID=A0A6G1JMR5_9PLEO|nr:hypothetical protein K458DRAFT_447981 [Lentithecium fluviatile CBS 122367]